MYWLVVLVAYAAALVALGLWTGRRVHGTADFFVAGRRLGPGLIFATVLAANIGAGSTVGAASLGYRDGLAAWWWVGSAGLGSLVLAFLVGPRIRRLAEAHNLRTVGDYLEWRYDRRVRAVIAALLWVGTLAILAGQLIAGARVLDAAAGIPKPVGCLIAGVVMTAYFTAGGLLSSAIVNLVQLVVLLLGFVVALPLALGAVGGFGALHGAAPTPAFWNFWHGGESGWVYLAMLGPSFVVSPGLLQKAYGAHNDRAVRVGFGLNAAVLLVFAFMPPLLGMIARVLHPGLPSRDLALPVLLVHDVPSVVGGLGLAALFSAELSSADAILFMLATSLSQDLYRRFVRPGASDAQVLRVARGASITGGALGVLLAIVSPTVTDALGIFYTLLSVSLFVPLLAGLFMRRARAVEALAATAGGVTAVVAMQLWTGGAAVWGWTPAMVGLVAAAAAFLVVGLARGGRATPSTTR